MNFDQAQSNNALSLDLEKLIRGGDLKKLDEATPDKTLALLQQNRILDAEKANLTIREALNQRGATIEACAETLSFLISGEGIKHDIRRRAVVDVLTLHGAMPNNKTDIAPTAIQVIIQSSEHVNLQNVFNPTLTRQSI